MGSGIRAMNDDFIDYYELLQISPNAELQTIQRVYRMLAARYHPDNPATGDKERFLLLQEAYRVLSNPELRSAYNARYQARHLQPLPVFETRDFLVGIEAEANRRLGVLCLLYNRRRTHPERPSLSMLELESLMAIPREHLEFTTWYLKQKNYITRDDSGELAITAEGVDFVESKAPENRPLYKLITGPLSEPASSQGESGSAG
jgi:curved DNA-binding protein CbpA